jgi:hypothetical protein
MAQVELAGLVNIIEVTTLNKNILGIICDLSITKTIGDLLDIIINKIKYSFTGNSSPNIKLCLLTNSGSILEPNTELVNTLKKFKLGLYKQDDINGRNNYNKLKDELFDTPTSIKTIAKSLTGRDYNINVDIDKTSVINYKYKLEELSGLPIDDTRVIYNGIQMEDHNLLKVYRIQDGSKINIVLRLRGGMLHEVSGRDDYNMLKPLVVYNAIKDIFENV